MKKYELKIFKDCYTECLFTVRADHIRDAFNLFSEVFDCIDCNYDDVFEIRIDVKKEETEDVSEE